MIQIPLNGGLFALIDDCDSELSRHVWTASDNGAGKIYVRRQDGPKSGRRTIYLHREVLRRAGYTMGRWDLGDHESGDTLDNRRGNLRPATQAINMRNFSGLRPNNSSGVAGVSFDRGRGKWGVKIRVDGRQVHLGRFDTLDEATAARLRGEREHWGIQPQRVELHACQ